jgi:tight adherence protein B
MNVAVRAGNVEVQAVKSALKDLELSYNEKSDIVKEVKNIILQYEKGGIELKILFEDLANRSDLEDIRSFATIYSVIEGKSDRFGDILAQTNDIIRDKIEIEQEIETTITSAKSETTTMLIMPIIIVIAMSSMGAGLTDNLFNTMVGHVAATIALIIFGLSYVLAVRSSNIEV